MQVILQKQRSRSHNGRDYHKYRLTVPAEVARMLRLGRGEKFEVSVDKGAIVFRKAIGK